MSKTKKSILKLVAAVMFFLPLISSAQDVETPVAPLIDDVTVYTLDYNPAKIVEPEIFISPDGNFKLTSVAKNWLKSTQVVLKRRAVLDHELPTGKMAVSDYWEIDIKNNKVYNKAKPLKVELHYQPDIFLKEVVYWNGKEWRKISSQIVDQDAGVISFDFPLPYARFLVVSDSAKMSQGQASWYKYKNCLCAASPDYPKGTKLKVTNVDNQKSVVVKVNDFGPERDIHPDRVIDLDVLAFKQIAKKGAGLASVIVEPVVK